jgi:hypothetical protein
MVSRPLLIALFASAVVLPIMTLIFYAAGRLLGAMQDTAGEAVLVRVSQATGIVWVLGLVVLLLGLTLDAIGRGSRGDGKES